MATKSASVRHGASKEAAQVGANAEQVQEIEEARSVSNLTRRATVPALEEMLYQFIPVLDRGFVRVIDYFGDDGAVVQAARVSYGRGTKKVSDDRNLIRYLMRHRHSTPFEMAEIKLHVKLPIFVARQWIRHRTANVNEYSARYSILDREFYVPDRKQVSAKKEDGRKPVKSDAQKSIFDVLPKDSITTAQSTTNRQGRSAEIGDAEVDEARRLIQTQSSAAYTAYTKLLNETIEGDVVDPQKAGLARELARMVLPTNYYTQWYWKIDLQNLLHFVSLRADPHAQYEIRVYAEVIADILAKWVPITWEAFRDYRMTGAAVSGPGLAVIKRLIAGEKVTQEGSGLSKREWAELMATLGREG